MKMRVRAGLVAAVLLSASVLQGCGGDEPAAASYDGDAYVEGIVTAWKNEEVVKISDAQTRCWGGKLLGRLGIDRIQSMGTPDQFGRATVAFDLSSMKLSKTEAQGVYDDFTSCGGNTKRDARKFVGTMGFPDNLNDCLVDVVQDTMMEDFVVTSLQLGQNEATAALDSEATESGLGECVDVLTPEQLADLAGEE